LVQRPGFGVILGLLLVLWLGWPANLSASLAASASQNEQVCDPLADYFLGMEDYPEAIRRHKLVIKEHPNNALAHYHLGFCYGVLGEHKLELAEYQKAIDLGLDDWQLFLNLGLLYMETGNTHVAMQVLSLATMLAPDRPEPHFNLGLAYQKLGMLAQAEQEVLQAVEIDPSQLDARNILGAIYAQEGKYSRAHDEWTELVEKDPGYAPARRNLAILERFEGDQHKDAPRHDEGAPRHVNGLATAP
jgi:tetratricopeptide (TPR) repeat protein